MILQSQAYLINFSHSRTHFIITILIANRSFFQPFLSLYLDCYYLNLKLLLFWTVTFLNCYSFELFLFRTITILNCYSFESLLYAEVAFWHPFRFLTLSIVLWIRFKQGLSRWKAKTRAYKSSEVRRTKFCPQDSHNCSSTNQTYYPIGSVMI
jgi:hypothetical protein